MSTEITTSEKMRAMRNEPVAEFTLANPVTGESRSFELKDLDYDGYLEFMDLARPIMTACYNAMSVQSEGGEFKLGLDPSGLDFAELIKLAGKELPRMVWLCCRMTDPKIKVEDVKRLAHRPHVLLEVVLMQIKHNKIVQDFQDFFPRIAQALEALAPAMTTTTEATDSTPKETPA
jgi:hypothetical protein